MIIPFGVAVYPRLRFGTSTRTRVILADGGALWRTPLLGAGAGEDLRHCHWCGERNGGRPMFVFTPAGPPERVADVVFGDLRPFCTLHCWGQLNGHTYL